MTSVLGGSPGSEGSRAVPALGSAAIAIGLGEDGVESVAVWHVSIDGLPSGAWVWKWAAVLGSSAAAARVLALVERRAIVGISAQVVREILRQLSTAAGVDDCGQWWDKHLFSPVQNFRETMERRRTLERTVLVANENNKSITALSWAHDLAESSAADTVALRHIAGIVDPPGTPVVSEALALARLLHWQVSVWTEAEDVKRRRTAVRGVHGPAEPLPPAWQAAVEVAASTRLPL